MKKPPVYAIASVDHALRLAAILQLEGSLSVTDAAERLGVARSTAHRLLAMLVYRDFAEQDENKRYRAGPVLELASHSQSSASRLRQAALPHLRELVDVLGESVNLTVRTGATARFIASAECREALRVGSREGMVFPAQQTTAGLLLLAELTDEELDAVYAGASVVPAMEELRRELAKVRRNGFALNQGRSERGVVAVGVPVRSSGGAAIAGMSVSMPSVRYDRRRLRPTVAALTSAAAALEADLAQR
ncbi:IclR family transcriptional regulator [Saccharopolyspora rhizosphaerae]|uniref:IclR family transcriptional regulator n=1 Tax=Saccharopolyspora rhizosphaerae TaxID=2492662 RepID=A0A3R8QB73_9PSEU|nr:IclR family transcriptional regulator [Saccharopolyspora rhizosphaerae]RRO17081.1 IclR family transcriptional regulator [Saccharopolyspora rhizosphaerae]